MRSPRPKGGGGGGLQNLYILRPIAMTFLKISNKSWFKIWYQQHLSSLKVTMLEGGGGAFPQNVAKTNDRKNMTYTIKEYNVWGCNYNITSVNDINMWYFICLVIMEDIPCLKLTYLLQLIVQILNETAIYHINFLLNSRWLQTRFIYDSIFLLKSAFHAWKLWKHFVLKSILIWNHFQIAISGIKYFVLIFFIIFIKKCNNKKTNWLVTRKRKFEHVTPILRSLHWLPIRARIQYPRF